MLKDTKRGLLFQMSYASASKYVSVGLRMLRGLALAKILGPGGFGIWTSMRLVLMFGSYSHGGARPGMVQWATHADGASDSEGSERYRAVASGINLAGALVAGVIVAGAALLHSGDRPELAAWLALAAVLVLRGLWLFHQSLLASRRRYAWRTTGGLAISALTTGLGIWAALEHGLFGFVAAMGASYVIALLAAQRLAGSLPRPRFERDAARRLVGVGLPIMGSNLLKILLWNVDKLLIWLLMGKVALGIYALQAQITNALMLLPAGVSEVFYPHLLSEIGRSRSRSTARAYLERGTDLLVRCMLPVLALTCLAFHLPIRWWMPEYVDAIEPGIALVLASFFPVAGALPANVLVALRGQRTLLAISGVAVAVATMAVTAAILSGGGYLGVALGVALGLFTRSALVIGAALRRSEAERNTAGRFVGRLGFGFGLLLAAVALARFAFPDRSESLSEDAIQTFLRCGLALVVLAPWVLAAWLRRPRSATPTFPDQERGTL